MHMQKIIKEIYNTIVRDCWELQSSQRAARARGAVVRASTPKKLHMADNSVPERCCQRGCESLHGTERDPEVQTKPARGHLSEEQRDFRRSVFVRDELEVLRVGLGA